VVEGEINPLPRIPLGKLFSHPFPYDTIDVISHTIHISQNVLIPIPHHRESHFLQRLGPGQISLFLIRRSVLAAVQLYHKLCFGAVEVRNKFPDGLLSLEPDEVISQKAILQQPFSLGHVLAKDLGQRDVFFAVRQHRGPF